MVSFKELRENTEDKLDVLVESGLFEGNRLSLLRRALDEDNTKMSFSN